MIEPVVWWNRCFSLYSLTFSHCELYFYDIYKNWLVKKKFEHSHIAYDMAFINIEHVAPAYLLVVYIKYKRFFPENLYQILYSMHPCYFLHEFSTFPTEIPRSPSRAFEANNYEGHHSHAWTRVSSWKQNILRIHRITSITLTTPLLASAHATPPNLNECMHAIIAEFSIAGHYYTQIKGVSSICIILLLYIDD